MTYLNELEWVIIFLKYLENVIKFFPKYIDKYI